jgi:hypothetical protein
MMDILFFTGQSVSAPVRGALIENACEPEKHCPRDGRARRQEIRSREK